MGGHGCLYLKKMLATAAAAAETNRVVLHSNSRPTNQSRPQWRRRCVRAQPPPQPPQRTLALGHGERERPPRRRRVVRMQTAVAATPIPDGSCVTLGRDVSRRSVEPSTNQQRASEANCFKKTRTSCTGHARGARLVWSSCWFAARWNSAAARVGRRCCSCGRPSDVLMSKWDALCGSCDT